MTAYRCSVASLEREEPLFATASRVDRWLAVEQRGPWSAETVPRSRLGESLAAALGSIAMAGDARLMLIRRPGGVPATGRRVFYADSRPGREQLLSRVVHDDAELARLALPGSQPAGWIPVGNRLLLVCTHGKHDSCCAIWGRPVVRALAARYPQETWECSHSGGDRFAPNLVVLPEGYYFGRLPAATAADIVAALDNGRLTTRHLRGRSSLGLPVQAAQHFARERFGTDDAADLTPRGVHRGDDGSWQVRLGSAERGEVAVTVLRVAAPEAHRLTCSAPAPAEAFSWVLVGLSFAH
jgi:hypothetical protein